MRVLLAQLPVPENPATNTPLAAGYLAAYAQSRGLLDRVSVEILPRALADGAGDALLVEAIVARTPDVLGLSLYTWNSERSLDIARRVRARLPGLLVVGGGPEVQLDNEWVLRHPGLDVAVVGEGEQTFADLLELLAGDARPRTSAALRRALRDIPGLAFCDETGALVATPARTPLADLSVVPSPYLLGYLPVGPGDLLMVEVTRWCPYACSFCLYGRNMGSRLGGRSFSLERVLAEIAWGRAQGVTRVHFIEANLNLVPIFRPLMTALADLNADRQLALYAELRGEHLAEETVAALARAGLRVAEVGLQTANPAALRAAQRRTDLQKWAAGARRLYQHGIDVLLDVILGLPEDDAAGIAATLEFVRREQLGPYDVFTLQLLPGTAVRQQAAAYGLAFQPRPPYYVLATDRLTFAELRALRAELKRGAALDPAALEGCPQPRPDALAGAARAAGPAISHIIADDAPPRLRHDQLALHVDVVGRWPAFGQRWSAWLAEAIAQNPATLIDLYLHCEQPPPPDELRGWRAALPFQPGYLDRLAVYGQALPDAPPARVSPRLWLVLPWTTQADPDDYTGVAAVIWRYEVEPGAEPPLAAWLAAGGAGILVSGAPPDAIDAWRAASGLLLWRGAMVQ